MDEPKTPAAILDFVFGDIAPDWKKRVLRLADRPDLAEHRRTQLERYRTLKARLNRVTAMEQRPHPKQETFAHRKVQMIDRLKFDAAHAIKEVDEACWAAWLVAQTKKMAVNR